jgi:hypothetical protein
VRLDVLALVRQAEDPARAGSIDPADEDLAGLGAAPWAREVGAGRDQVQELEPGFPAASRRATSGALSPCSMMPATGSSSQGWSITPSAPIRNCSISTT